MGEESSVKLIGSWFSSYSFKVICGLELKGIKYEYIKEDLMNKNTVFVHGGNSILESMVILEYIEETWPNDYSLLPKDPYENSIARFWIKFIEEKNFLQESPGEEYKKAKREILEILEILKTIEEQSALGDDDNKYFGGDKINAVDLAFAFIAHWFEPMEEVAGVKLLEVHKFPKLYAWTERFKQNSVVKINLPDYNEMVGFFKDVKEYGYLTPPPKKVMFLKSPLRNCIHWFLALLSFCTLYTLYAFIFE
ncbi:hypothetical protein MKX01_038103 [Papaver californicum]|nr:hypothetical protein MKX01_038103 [Papaver californicum]